MEEKVKKTKKVSAKKEATNKSEFAVIETGGKQYRVGKGDTIKIEKLKDDQKEGEAVIFDKVLFHQDGDSVKIGSPYLDMKVMGSVAGTGRNKKVIVMKYKAKSRYKKTRGHRQPFTLVTIESIK